MSKTKRKFYAVRKGRKPGIYLTWEECSQQVTGVAGAIYKSFETRAEAERFLAAGRGTQTAGGGRKTDDRQPTTAEVGGQQAALPMAIDEGEPAPGGQESDESLKQVMLYTDGGCFVNPGPGGYAAVLLYGKHRREISGGFRLTTNNRMELMGCIAGLRLLIEPAKVRVNTDSRYIVNSMTKGWAKRWKAARWRRDGVMVPNADLWAELLMLCARHNVSFEWLRGHAGDPENERCHVLATAAMQQPNLPEDTGFNKRSAISDQQASDE
jgi:ribonuclease HI